MRYIDIPNTDLRVSTFCQGVMPLWSAIDGEEMDALLDAFVERGGNFFDTAHCYAFWAREGAGSSERAIADYLHRRGLWDQVVLATKGGHPGEPGYRKVEWFLSPERIAADIDDSLGRMQIDCIDLYWLHRDDPRLPVGEIVDCLNAEVERGRIRYFAGSNWSGARLEEANAYAAAKGVQGFVASQPCWSAASKPMGRTMRELSPEDWEFHKASGMPVIPYSPTAQGYFATNGKRGKAYDRPENHERLAKVNAMAKKLGASPNQVALAWLLAQPFPVIPILGTTRIDHLIDGLGAADITVDLDEL
jgi:aryl-alcohol dehydrogenase-like predicted oxidoreductase